MATYNRGRHIFPSIQSVLRQGLQDFEVLVVGDGCTDDTKAVVESFGGPVRWLELPERSGSQAGPNNLGIAEANAPNIAYLGHDDVWAPDHLSTLAALFSDNSELGFAVGGLIYHMPPGVPLAMVTGLFTDEAARFEQFFPPSSLAHRRSVVDAIGGWRPADEINAPVDADFALRAAAAGFSFASTMKVTVHKFAAGHRYLSYLHHTSDEQVDMLQRMERPGFDAFVDRQIDLARDAGHFGMKHPDFNVFEKGQAAKENLARKGLVKPVLAALVAETVVPDDDPAARALDWEEKRLGLRRASLNPRPKLLMPFSGEGPVDCQILLAHSDPKALGTLTLGGGGVQRHALVGAPFQVDDHWEALATFGIALSPNDYTVLEFHLKATQHASIAIGAIVLKPGRIEPEQIAAHFLPKVLRAENAALRRHIVDLDLAVNMKAAENDRLASALADAVADTQAIVTSRTWRATGLVRTLMTKLRATIRGGNHRKH